MQKVEKKINDSLKKIELISNIISKRFFGQKKVVEQVLVSLLSSGNTLLVGVPGLGKTLLFKILSENLNLTSSRIQCTPDLMPFDIIGTEVLSTKDIKKFSFIKGPIFCQILMVDEINRTSPRTQSALLQAMQEGFVTVNGKNFNLPEPFIVLATENPIEQEGTYNLPEAQLDRFLMQVNITYPDKETEKNILSENTEEIKNLSHSFKPNDLIELIKTIDSLPIGDSVFDFVLDLIRNLRPETSKFGYVRKFIKWGPGPRGGQALIRCSKSRGFLRGNLSPSVNDVIQLAQPTLRHRISLTFEAKTENFTSDYLIKKVCDDLN